MNAAETIQAAIVKLEQQREAAMPGPWIRTTWTHWGKPAAAVTGQGKDDDEVGYPLNDGDADLIVTLYRTIDAQLAILRDGAETLASLNSIGFGGGVLGRAEPAVTLARAILGEVSE